MRGSIRGRHWLAIGASILLGLIFVTAGLGKLPYHGEFLALILSKSFLTLSQAVIVVHWLPWVELVLGLLLITGIATKLMASLSAVLIIAFIANNSWMISLGLGGEPCGCFGNVEHLALAQLSNMEALYLDIGMLALTVIILLCYPGNFITIRPLFLAILGRGKIAGKKDWVGTG